MHKSDIMKPPGKFYHFAEFDQVLIGGKPFIAGRPNFQQVSLFGLQPGMLVHKIGVPGRNGKVTSSSRVDTWTPHVEYMGKVYVEDFNGEGIISCMAFKLPAGGLVHRADKEQAEETPYFALYAMIPDTQLVRPNLKRHTIEFFWPVFTLSNGDIIK